MQTMWKGKKKFIVIGLLAVVVIAGSIAGMAYAAGPTPTPPTGSANVTLLDRVATILKIDPATLKSAVAQAQKEQQDQALTDRLNKAVADGKLTQPQADQYNKWWQSRPTTPAPGFGPMGGHFGGRGMLRGGFRMPQGAPQPTK
jgi:hypothetical protein